MNSKYDGARRKVPEYWRLKLGFCAALGLVSRPSAARLCQEDRKDVIRSSTEY